MQDKSLGVCPGGGYCPSCGKPDCISAKICEPDHLCPCPPPVKADNSWLEAIGCAEATPLFAGEFNSIEALAQKIDNQPRWFEDEYAPIIATLPITVRKRLMRAVAAALDVKPPSMKEKKEEWLEAAKQAKREKRLREQEEGRQRRRAKAAAKAAAAEAEVAEREFREL